MSNASRAMSKVQPSKAQPKLMSAPVPEAEADRRLGRVLDAMYSHNSKQALKLLQQALQKRPGWPAARALRASVYLQIERWDDARNEVSNLRGDLDAGRVPIDEDAARKLFLYYREMRHEETAGEIYEQAWIADPANVRLAETAFCLYMRGYAFSEAQKIATKLHRFASAKTQKYGLWATAALWVGLLFRTRNEEGAAAPDQRMLKLACAMMGKALAASTTPSAETVRFAVRVYAEAGEIQSARQLVSHPRLVMDEAEVLHIRSDLSVAQDDDVRDYCEVLFEHDPDDWVHWLKYFNVVHKRDTWREEATDFIDKVHLSLAGSAALKRGPHLARVELFYRDQNLKCLAESVQDYFAKFGAKTVCAHDLRPYLCFLARAPSFHNVLRELSRIAEQKGFSHQLTVSWLRLWFNQLDETPEVLVTRYSSQLSDTLEATDRQVGDDYLIMAVHRLLPASETSDTDRYSNSAAILESIAILETGLCRSPFNFHFKLLLMRLYIEIGAMERVAELWDSLNVKHIQLATLTHLVLRPFFETGHHFALRNVLENVEMLWRECDREIPESVSKAFQVGAINAAIEFLLFKVRLEKSSVLARSLITESQLELIVSDGEPLGVQRALGCLSFSPRFNEEMLRSKKIIDNNDSRCFQFWEIRDYDPDNRLTDLDMDDEEGMPLSSDEKAILRADLVSQKTLLKIASAQSGKNSATSEGSANAAPRTRQEKELNNISPLCKLRFDISQNLRSLQIVLRSCAQGSRIMEKEIDEPNCEQLLTESKDILQRLVSAVEDAVSEHSGMAAENLTMTPRKLRACGRVTYDILLITSVTVCSLSADLVKGRRRTKKAGTAMTNEFKLARNGILGYRDGLMSACSVVQEWVTTCLENETDWLGAVLSGDHGLSDLVPYLPETVHPVDLNDGRRKCVESISRSEFCSEIVNKILASHSTACSALLETLSSITRRLKLTDL